MPEKIILWNAKSKLKGDNMLTNYNKPIAKSVDIPIELYESTLEKYFIGYADNLIFGEGTSA